MTDLYTTDATETTGHQRYWKSLRNSAENRCFQSKTGRGSYPVYILAQTHAERNKIFILLRSLYLRAFGGNRTATASLLGHRGCSQLFYCAFLSINSIRNWIFAVPFASSLRLMSFALSDDVTTLQSLYSIFQWIRIAP